MVETHDAAANREKQLVALSSVAAAVLLTALKVVVGVMSGSLGILSEAAHSALDLVAAGVTLWAVRVSGEPPDPEHTYGHGKVENISALFETLLLLATCVWIIYEAARRLFVAPVAVDPSVWTFAVMVVSIGVDYSRSRALTRVAKKYHSQALEADALHFSTDIWSSAVVILGLGLVLLAKWLHVPWLGQADAVAALGVAGIVVWVSVRLGKRSIDDLVDAVPAHLRAEVVAAARVAGVLDVPVVRIRKSGAKTFVDLVLRVARHLPLEAAHALASRAEEAVAGALDGADVMVHLEPARTPDEPLHTTVRALAARAGMAAHAVHIYDGGERTSVELHLEVDAALTLRAAHEQVTRFEQALRAQAPSIEQIVSHIEPAGGASARRHTDSGVELPVLRVLRELAAASDLVFEPHDVRVRHVGDELDVSLHCIIDAETAIADAHRLTEWLEKALRERVPGLGRVLIHAEPPEQDEGAVAR